MEYPLRDEAYNRLKNKVQLTLDDEGEHTIANEAEAKKDPGASGNAAS